MRKVFGLLVVLGCVGCESAWTYGRAVEGKIVSAPVSRFKKSADGGGQEKIALKLNPYTADARVKDTAAGPSGLVVECLSTRCAQVSPGECHRFACKYERREGYFWGGEPNVIMCKHEREIECKTAE